MALSMKKPKKSAEKPQVTWGQAQTALRAQADETKTITFPDALTLPDGTKADLWFRYRQLTQLEQDRVEKKAIKVKVGKERGERSTSVETNNLLMKTMTVQFGTVESLEGWTGSAQDVALLPPKVLDKYADAIEEFGTMPEHEEVIWETFREE